MNDWIKIQGARENNLKNISLSIPRNKLVVLTGLSGSGKSTLAMNTLQQECQRQYMDSLGMISDFIHKPKVDSIEGLSPSICIDQRHTNRNPRSTVGTPCFVYCLPKAEKELVLIAEAKSRVQVVLTSGRKTMSRSKQRFKIFLCPIPMRAKPCAQSAAMSLEH